MLEIGERITSSGSRTWIEVTDRSDGKLSFVRNHAPNTGKADPHYHLDFTQTWEALEGEGEIEVDGESRPLRKGDRVVLEPGTPHRDPYLPAGGELRIRGSFDPCTPFIESFAEVWAHHLQAGTVDEQDQIPLMQILVIAEETRAQSYTTAAPRILQRAGLPFLAAFGRLRGYKPSYSE